MTAREKVVDVERQIHAMVNGGQDGTFCCPFCDALSNRFNKVMCCELAADVVNAVLDHMEHLDRTEVVEKAMERFEKLQARAILN